MILFYGAVGKAKTLKSSSALYIIYFLQISYYNTHSKTLGDHLEISAVEKMLFQRGLKLPLSFVF